MVIMPHARKAVVSDSTKPEVAAASHSVRCSIRKPLDNSKLTPQCEPTVLNGPSSLNYPPESRKAGEEGTVLVEFSLTSELGHPTDIVASAAVCGRSWTSPASTTSPNSTAPPDVNTDVSEFRLLFNLSNLAP